MAKQGAHFLRVCPRSEAMSAFVPAPATATAKLSPQPTPAFRGIAPRTTQLVSIAGEAIAPMGVAVLAGVVGVVANKKRKPRRVARAAASSYKEFEDPWLGSADFGFDPFGLATKGGTFDTAPSAVAETTYYNYRESEVKHGRFAMTAFLAIFADSADRDALFAQAGSTTATDRLDATLGLDEFQAPAIALALGYQALAEYNLQQGENDGNFLSVEYKKDRCPGDLGFDPVGVASTTGGDKKGLHNIEVNLGRLAMIGITSFLVREFIVKDEGLLQKLLSDSKL